MSALTAAAVPVADEFVVFGSRGRVTLSGPGARAALARLRGGGVATGALAKSLESVGAMAHVLPRHAAGRRPAVLGDAKPVTIVGPATARSMLARHLRAAGCHAATAPLGRAPEPTATGLVVVFSHAPISPAMLRGATTAQRVLVCELFGSELRMHLVGPGSHCIDCVHGRLRQLLPAGDVLYRHLAQVGTAPVCAAADVIDGAASAVAEAVLAALHGRFPSYTLRTVETATGRIDVEHVRPLPGCRCGHGGRSRLEFASIVGRRVGIVREVVQQQPLSGEESLPPAWLAAVAGVDSPLASAGAVGWTLDDTMPRVLGEAVERYSGRQFTSRLGRDALVDALDATSGEHYPVAARDVGLLPRGEGSSSTGLAAGEDFASAALAGVLEVVERDTLMTHWLADMPPAELDAQAVAEDPDVQRHLSAVEAAALRLRLFVLVADVGIPCVLAALESPGGRHGVHITLGSACRPTVSQAVVPAVREAVQLRASAARAVGGRRPAMTGPSLLDHLVLYQAAVPLERLQRYLTGADAASPTRAIRPLSGRTPETQFVELAQRLDDLGHRVLVKEVTSPDVRDVATVVRVVALGTVDLGYVARDGAVPLSLERTLRRTENNEVRTLPHPFG